MRQHFVCARITRMNGVNLNRFEFDYDTTWAAFFLDEKLNVYSRYGGRDEGEPEDRLSKQSLLQTMREVLDVHARRRMLNSSISDALVQPVPKRKRTPADIPLLKKNHQGCVHCHQIREYEFLQLNKDGQFKRQVLFTFPLPENIGIVFERRHGHRIERTLKGFQASQSGLLPGDTVVRVNNVPVHSEYDFRWALHRASDRQPLTIVARRPQQNRGGSETIAVKLQPKGDWRLTDLGWRKSMRSVPFRIGFRGYSLTRSQRKSAQIPENRLAIRVIAVQPIGLGNNLGVQKRDIIVGINGGQTGPSKFQQFKSDLLRVYKPGDTVRLAVVRAGEKQELTGKFPDWFTDETLVP